MSGNAGIVRKCADCPMFVHIDRVGGACDALTAPNGPVMAVKPTDLCVAQDVGCIVLQYLWRRQREREATRND